MQRGTCVTSILACYHAGLLYIIQSLHSSMLNCHIRLSTTTLQPGRYTPSLMCCLHETLCPAAVRWTFRSQYQFKPCLSSSVTAALQMQVERALFERWCQGCFASPNQGACSANPQGGQGAQSLHRSSHCCLGGWRFHGGSVR